MANYPPQMAEYIRRTATNLGINPSDLATAISYETGGKFDQNMWGGAGGRHMGLIQFGPEERAKYGVKEGMPLDAHFGAVENYLRDRGLKPGMGMLDLYSTINAGRPGLYDRSDANNGGAPGTVADKVAEQMVGHRARANTLLGDTSNPISIATPVQAAQQAALAPSPGAEGPTATGNETPAAQAGSLDLTKLIQGVAGMGGQQQQKNELQPVPISVPIPPNNPAAQRLAQIMQSLGRPS